MKYITYIELGNTNKFKQMSKESNTEKLAESANTIWHLHEEFV